MKGPNITSVSDTSQLQQDYSSSQKIWQVASAERGDLNLFFNGNFIQPHLEGQPKEARALLASAGRIVAIGPEAESLRGSGIPEIDLEGGTAIPGPVDAHCHLVSFGMIRMREADLRGVRSLAELRSRLQAHAARGGISPGRGRWLLGRAFDQDLLPGGRWPTRQDLDEIAPDIPLRITRVCGHAMVANTAALRESGYAPDFRKGELPEGVLTEEAMGPVQAAVPEPTRAEWLVAGRWAMAEAARAGFVGVHSLMAHAEEVRALVELRRAGSLPIRVWMHPPYSMLKALSQAGLVSGFGDEFLRFGAIKLFSDGSFGARSAALRAPYADDPGETGELIHSPAELTERIRRVYAAGWQVCVHAIGDRAVETTLSALASATQAAFGADGEPPLPPRIEHGSCVPPDLIPQLRAQGVGIAVQPQFARSDYWLRERLGAERLRHTYAFRALWDAGIPLALSTDCPVEQLDALAVLGQLIHPPTYLGDERRTKALPLLTALRLFSEGGYRLQGAVAGTGTLCPGQFADFVVLSRDPRVVPPEEIERLQVVRTVVGGQVVHPAP